jgi:predicted metal-binding transcription factor (methanogenesis marker protein 9)
MTMRDTKSCEARTFSLARIGISPIEVLALKKLALINDALARSLRDEGARREQLALLKVLMDVTARADLANHTRKTP